MIGAITTGMAAPIRKMVRQSVTASRAAQAGPAAAEPNEKPNQTIITSVTR